ncbi:hypothetical protein LIER_43397 [Lithospermum erythrorhizon]|uniref:Uncharacterized protein n=1 Tax=Lithospermum erythrorhizon TaxID=34254 RepID=A0AAV3Q1F4_LITER
MMCRKLLRSRFHLLNNQLFLTNGFLNKNNKDTMLKRLSREKVALNLEEEEAKWRFVASRRIAAERMLSEVTKKNADIMGILEDAEVMPFIETIGPSSLSCVSETLARVLYIIGMRASFNLEQFIFEQVVQHARSHVVLKPIAYPSLLCNIIEAQQPDILTAADEEAPSHGFTTISPKLLQGTHVADIPLRAIETGSGSGAGNEATARFLKDEIKQLDGVIQSSLARKSVLEAHLRSFTGEDDPVVAPDASDSEAEASQE